MKDRPAALERWLLRKIPEARARRWAAWTSRAMMVVAPAYLVAWWGFGLRGWALRHMDLGLAAFLSMAWVPLSLICLFVQSVLLAHFSISIREHVTALEADRLRFLALADAELRRHFDLPETDRPEAIH